MLPADATNKAVSWSSSNTGVATVDASGVVTAVGGGTGTITVKTADGGYTASCTVTVTVPVTGVSLDKSALVINKGNTGSLTATITPADATDKAVTWNSSNTSIATVDSFGHVTAVSYGTATISATTQDGGFASVCTVSVPITWTETYDDTVSSTNYSASQNDTLNSTSASGTTSYIFDSPIYLNSITGNWDCYISPSGRTSTYKYNYTEKIYYADGTSDYAYSYWTGGNAYCYWTPLTVDPSRQVTEIDIGNSLSGGKTGYTYVFDTLLTLNSRDLGSFELTSVNTSNQ